MTGEKDSLGYADAAQRVDNALTRLEASLRSLNGRVRSLSRIEDEVRALEQDRARLNSELHKASNKARRLDDAAGDVSRRLVSAMEQVKSIVDAQDEADA